MAVVDCRSKAQCYCMLLVLLALFRIRQMQQQAPTDGTSVNIKSFRSREHPETKHEPTTISALPTFPSNITTTTTTSIPKLTEGWWTPYISSSSRVYSKWNEDPFEWCILEDPSNLREVPPRGTNPTGLLFVKSYKASSTTGAAVTLAIAHHVARRKQLSLKRGKKRSITSRMAVNESLVCRHYHGHAFGNAKRHGTRDQPSLLWTFVRHPQARDVSHFFYFNVARDRKTDPDDLDAFQTALLSKQGYQTKYIRPFLSDDNLLEPEVVRSEPWRVARYVSNILKHYNFVGISERLDESLAVASLLWGLDPTDVIVFSAKQQRAGGARYDTATFRQGCVKTQNAVLTQQLGDFLVSPGYVEGHADFLLYAAAEASLDRTIQALGIEVVQQRATLIRQLQQLAMDNCRDKVAFPCAPETGIYQPDLAKQNCYQYDAGCGYACVDQVMKKFRENKVTIPPLR